MNSCHAPISILAITFLLTFVFLPAHAGDAAPDDAAVSAKADTLLKSMTLDEKIGQMTQVDMAALKDKADIEKYFLGSMLSGGNSDPADISAAGWAKAYDEYQSYALKTRLKIPLIYGIDAVHGHNNVNNAVIFPHNVGLGATRNATLVEQAERVTGAEVAGTGINWAFAPCVATVRNIRWGRSYESFGETPELTAMMGAAAVRGLQGSKLSNPDSVVACTKHFIGDGGTTDGKDQGDTACDEAMLRKIHLPAYIAAIKAGTGTIMVSFSSWNGKKMHGNKYLLTDVLKGELGFQGFLISVWAAIDQLSDNNKNNIETSVNAGLDMYMIPEGPGKKNNYVEFVGLMKELVNEGRVPMSRIDDAVARILRVKIKSGLFEHPVSDPALTALVGDPKHRAVARECVRQSLVLLKNDKKTLPLSKSIRKVVIVGKGGDDISMQCGGWTIDWQGTMGVGMKGGTTLLAAIKQAVKPGTEVVFSADGEGIKGADAIIAVVGEEPYAEMFGDRKELNLSEKDQALIEKIKPAQVPIVTVIFSGRPLILGKALESSSALVEAWLPGTEGQGLADVLFGDVAPNGKLPVTWPRSMEQVPYDASKGEPQFPFGFGLTY